MSRPSRPNRERCPRKKRYWELKREVEELPIVVRFYEEDRNEFE